MINFDLAAVDAALKGRLVVSCQPVPGGALDDDEFIVRLARAAIDGGAAGVRLEGAARVTLARRSVSVPIIGIIKQDLENTQVRITSHLHDVDALVAAGADIIAFDATIRARPVPVRSLVERIHGAGKIAMADCATVEDARQALACGCDIVGTTLSGYTGGQIPAEPDLQFLKQLVALSSRVMAEGRYGNPVSVAKARALGAWAVTVGTAITRIELIVAEYAEALVQADTEALSEATRLRAQQR